jgi:hypothetical protein
MIQCGTVRAIALAFVLCNVAHAEGVAVYWQPPGEVPSVKEAFTLAVSPMPIVDASEKAQESLSLVPQLDAAKLSYTKFAFADAITKLDELQRLADAGGGGDLDARQLSEIFFYRGLSRLETGANEAAWEDLVHAARLDPSRIVDPARYPPRAVAAYKRAVAEVAQLHRGALALDVPENSLVRIDGAPSAGAVTLGAHFVSVKADGYEPWAGVVTVSGHDRFTPPLHAYRPPDPDRVTALAGSVRRVWLGALERNGSSWRFVVRAFVDGKTLSDSVSLGEAPTARAVADVVKRLQNAVDRLQNEVSRLQTEVNRLPAAANPSPAPRKRWWAWAVAGGISLAVVAVGLGVGLGTASSTGQVGGPLGTLK